MNDMQNLWLANYNNYLKAASPFGELSPSDYTSAKEFADSVLESLDKLKNAGVQPVN